MKNYIKLTLLAFASMLLITSCEDDILGGGGGTGGGGTTDTNPEIILVDEVGFLSTDTTVEPGSSFSVRIQAAAGTADLQAIEILEDGVRIGNVVDRLTINGTTASSAAPLVAADETRFVEWVVSIVAQADQSERLYEFRVIDVNGNSDSAGLFISTVPTQTQDPVLTLGGSGMFMGNPGNIITIPIDLIAGTEGIVSIAVFEESELVSTDRLWIVDLMTNFEDNPQVVGLEAGESLSTDIFIRAHEDFGPRTYTIALIDGNSDNFLTMFTIDTGEPATTVTELRGVLFNRAGPAGTGGLDLDSGAGTGSSDPSAELRDEGIDGTQAGSANWIQRISGVNGTTIRQLIPNQNGLSETFSFESIVTAEAIQDIWNNGVDFSTVNSDGNLISKFIEVGDTFIAMRDGTFYTFVIREVNVTPADNNDNYVLDVKF